MRNFHRIVGPLALTICLFGCDDDGDVELVTDAEPGQSDTGATPETDAGAAPEADSGAEPKTDMGAEPEADMGAEPEADMGAEPEADMGAEPEADAGAEPGIEFTSEPTLSLNERESVPQAAVLRFETDLPCTAEATVTGGGDTWTLRFDDPDTAHFSPVLGLLPETEYRVEVRVNSVGRTGVGETEPITTPPLPDDFPPIGVSLSEPDAMAPGWTFFNVRGPGSTWLIVVDEQGRVRWFHRDDRFNNRNDHIVLENGNVLFEAGQWLLTEMNWLGRLVRFWHAADKHNETDPPESSVAVADAETFHHEIGQLPSGNLFALGSEAVEVEGYPTSVDNPDARTETATIVTDVIHEFTPEGETVGYHLLSDVLDPRRVGRSSLGGFWHNRGYPESRDWTHANGLFYDAESDAWLVSVRHQDAVVKIARADGSLIWILGNHANWGEAWQPFLLDPVGELEWPYHQHAVTVTPNGGVGMFDNGNFRAPAFAEPREPLYSRAVEYVVDEDAMTVTERWSYGDPEGPDAFYARFISDADWLPNGNVLVTPGGQSTGPDGHDYAQILEVTEDGARVFELTIRSRLAEDPPSFTIYRAARIPPLY